MPKPPGIIDRVNYVVRSWDNPCDLPWAVVVETALPAALQAVVAIACFGILDVARFILRPARLRSGRHGRKGRKGRRSRSPLAFLSRTVRKLPPLAVLRQRKVTQGVRTMWIIDGIGQRLLWWWLVADVASGFFYNWTTMIQKTERCQQASGPGAGLAGGGNTSFLALQGWRPVAYPDVDYERGAANVGGFAFTTGGGDWSVAGGGTYKNDFTEEQTLSARIIINSSEGQSEFLAGDQTVQPGATVQFLAIADYHGAAFGAVEVKINQGFGSVSDGELFILGHANPPGEPTKFDCPITKFIIG